MSAVVETDWKAEALQLRQDGKDTSAVAEAVGKHPATIRKLFARNPVPSSNGHVPDLMKALEESLTRPDEIPGQTTVDDHLAKVLAESDDGMEGTYRGYGDGATPKDVPPEDDPEWTPPEFDKPADSEFDIVGFKAEAGEAVGPMPEREMDGGVTVETRLHGTRQEAFDFGPHADIPVGGTLVIKSDKLASGFFGLGDVITGTFTARVVDVGGRERLQRASEEFRAQPQSHVALITEIEVD